MTPAREIEVLTLRLSDALIRGAFEGVLTEAEAVDVGVVLTSLRERVAIPRRLRSSRQRPDILRRTLDVIREAREPVGMYEVRHALGEPSDRATEQALKRLLVRGAVVRERARGRYVYRVAP